MSDDIAKSNDQTAPSQVGGTPAIEQAAKPALTLSKLTSKFADSRRETPVVSGPTYAEQMENKPSSASEISEAFSAKKPTKSPTKVEKTSTRPFSEFRQTELGKRIQVQLPKPVDLALRVHAASTGNLVTHVIDIAIEDYLNKHGIKI
ncbi:hypothetical protein ACQKJ1_23975 [Methylorubrum rhodesianum]|jgi:hypothetical protein|uniref:hypothetical protein n=1 Tax=Methylobacteriaceae TaxID=119045 RepID=UPI001F132A7C|nr:hypothetical protein [Methylobacterium organophilum]UMY20308.1 hypothetical protein MMB17_25040 [Methylobacterium organophilum]